MITLYNVISADGFIARKDGSEDFIPDHLWQNFLDLCVEYGTLVIGRKTYEALQRYDEELLKQFEQLPIKKVILTTNPNFKPKEGYTIAHSTSEISAINSEVLVASGATLNNQLLKEGMVDKVILYELPVAIGEGIKPFDTENLILEPIKSDKQVAGVNVREYRLK